MLLLSTHISLRTVLEHSKVQMANIIIQTRPSPTTRTHTARTPLLTHLFRSLVRREVLKVLQFRQLRLNIFNMSKLLDMLTDAIW